MSVLLFLPFLIFNDFYFFYYSWLQCSVNLYSSPKWPSQAYAYIYVYIYIWWIPIFFFSPYHASCSIVSDQIQFPLLYRRISLLIHFKCNSLHLLIPDSQSITLPPSSLSATTSLFSMSISLFHSTYLRIQNG